MHEFSVTQLFAEILYTRLIHQKNSNKKKKYTDGNASFLARTFKLLLDVPLKQQKRTWIERSEASYSRYFVLQLPKTITKLSTDKLLYFHIREYKPESIKHKIACRNDEKSKAYSYNTDGCHTVIVGRKTIEFSTLKVAGIFGISDIAKGIKGHIKELKKKPLRLVI
ncbi:hypothetical protein BD560DRAFT_422377 [Blakeslea trispora]|nr:hypothetical protein BD560DRAFT_422377 [Blakeslea trispora]